MAVTSGDVSLDAAARRYRKHAQAERRSVALLYVSGLAFGLAAVVLAVWASTRLTFNDRNPDVRNESATTLAVPTSSTTPSVATPTSDPLGQPPVADSSSDEATSEDKALELISRLIAPVLCLALAIVAIRQAERHRRQASEHQRIAMQLGLLRPFLDGMPSCQAHVLRGSIAPLVFSRLLEDDDPLRAAVWPSPEQLQQLGRQPGGEATDSTSFDDNDETPAAS